MMRWVIFIAFYAFFGAYAFQALKTLQPKAWVWWLISIAWSGVLVFFIAQFASGVTSRIGVTPITGWAFGLLLSVMVFKMTATSVLLSEDLVRFIVAGFRKVVGDPAPLLPGRRKFISALALGIASLPFGALLYGMYKGKYNYKVLSYELYFDDLPEAFDGFKITQISDIHSGSFDDPEKVAYGVDLVNAEKADLVVFTGDLVNNSAVEMKPWVDIFAQISAPVGKYSILGNHDYGDYIEWSSDQEKADNFADLVGTHEKIGFDLLRNEHRVIEKDGQQIHLIGVENWGRGRFIKKGDLALASDQVPKDGFKVLLSHDPSHWEDVVLKEDTHYHLTLSGHTHGMQFGVEIPGWIKWSPVQWRYTYWAGLYQEMGQWINVNRGFGFIGYPGRVGMWPEITSIVLKKGTNTVA